MGATEVTVGEFRRFVKATNYKSEHERRTPAQTSSAQAEGSKSRLSWSNPIYPQTDDFPVGQVSWNDAVAFCNWLSTEEQRAPRYHRDNTEEWRFSAGNGYRLPTEAEWEFACRAGTTTAYFWGDDSRLISRYGSCRSNSGASPQPVGTKLPNAFGLFDMSGNVREWVQDWSDQNYFKESSPIDPLGPKASGSHVVRSSAYYQPAPYARSAYRNNFSTMYASNGLGFRIARDAVPAATALAAKLPAVGPAPQGGKTRLNAPASNSRQPPALASAPFSAVQAREYQQNWANFLNVLVERTDKNGATMMLIPPGEFIMGATPQEVESALQGKDPDKDKRLFAEIGSSQPQHRVRISRPFWLASTDVTIGQFREFVTATGYRTEAERSGQGGVAFVDGKTTQNPEFIWSHPGYDQTDDCPVSQVSWNDSLAFCNWLSNRNKLPPVYVSQEGGGWKTLPGSGYRLPTEAEWEFACRAGSATTYFWGDEVRNIDGYCWYGANSAGQTHPVRHKLPNAFGLFDMEGNARQWVQDWNSNRVYANSVTIDPRGPVEGGSKVARGSTCNNLPSYSRSAYRNWFDANYASAGHGFRVAQSVSEAGGDPVP
jgi:formylglycine-generating enzyme required for sulfatase activity